MVHSKHIVLDEKKVKGKTADTGQYFQTAEKIDLVIYETKFISNVFYANADQKKL